MRRRIAAAGIAALMALAACTNGTTEPETPSPTPTPSPEPATSSPEPSETPLPTITQAPEHSGEPPTLPEAFGGWTNLDPPRTNQAMYQSEAGIFTVLHGVMTDANREAEAHLIDPQHIGNWLCGEIDLGDHVCITNAWDGAVSTQTASDFPLTDLAAAGDELLAAWR